MMPLALLQGAPSISFDVVVDKAFQVGETFYRQGTTSIAVGIFWLCVVFHLIYGAIELANQEKCRFFDGKWWFRIFMVLTLFIGYQTVFVDVAKGATKKYFNSFAIEWVDMWEGQEDINLTQKQAAQQNRELEEKVAKDAAPATTEQSRGWMTEALMTVAQWAIGLLGTMLCAIAGMFIMVFLLLQGFFVVGMNSLLIAFGPIAIATLAHEKIEQMFWMWLKAWFVYGLLYMPLLGLAGGIAGSVFNVVTSAIADAGFQYQDGTDVGMHFIISVLAPLGAFAVVTSVPAFVSMLFQAGFGASASHSAASGAVAGAGASQLSEKGSSAASGGGSSSAGGGSGASNSGGGSGADGGSNSAAVEARG